MACSMFFRGTGCIRCCPRIKSHIRSYSADKGRMNDAANMSSLSDLVGFFYPNGFLHIKLTKNSYCSFVFLIIIIFKITIKKNKACLFFQKLVNRDRILLHLTKLCISNIQENRGNTRWKYHLDENTSWNITWWKELIYITKVRWKS